MGDGEAGYGRRHSLPVSGPLASVLQQESRESGAQHPASWALGLASPGP